jgi:cardiolipin synthase A/B
MLPASYYGSMHRKGNLGFTALIAVLLVSAAILAWFGLRGSSGAPAPLPIESLGPNVLCLVTPSAEARDLVVEDIAKAQKSVFVECYLMSDPAVVEALCSARSRGCDVRVLMEESPYGGFSMNDSVRNTFRSAGIDANWGNRVYSFTHAKFIVIDSTTAWVMTANLTKSAFDKNREVLVRSGSQELVRDLVRVFWADRRRGPCNVDGLVLSPVNARRDLVVMLKSAHSNVDVASEVLDDDEVMSTLEDLSSRGIRVRVLVATPDTVAINAVSRQRLERTGVAVRYLQSPYLHAKYIIVDGGLAYVGSHNLTTGSLDENREVGIITDHAMVVKTIEASFVSDWSAGT